MLRNQGCVAGVGEEGADLREVKAVGSRCFHGAFFMAWRWLAVTEFLCMNSPKPPKRPVKFTLIVLISWIRNRGPER